MPEPREYECLVCGRRERRPLASVLCASCGEPCCDGCRADHEALCARERRRETITEQA